MDYLQPAVAVAGGVVLLLVGGEVLVKHAVHMAVSYRVPKTIVGAVILGFGTSLPELLVSVTAAVDGSPGIAIGNVVGSNIANVGLILGLGAFMVTLHVQRRVLRADLPLGVLAALFLMIWVGPHFEVTRLTGVLLLTGFAVYLWLSLRDTRRFRVLTAEAVHATTRRPLLDIALSLLGLALIVAGARVLVWGATDMARLLQVSERVIGLSMVAVSTSLPELAACYAAARKGEADLVVGNIAGSNLFNLLFVLGTTAVVHPIPVEPVMEVRDFPILAAFSVLAFPLMATARRISRVQGLVLLALYAVYIGITWGTR
jgi:cation:H+ antiporter